MRAAAVRAAPETAVLAVAAALRLVDLGRVPGDPYYDAAVRSMGTSWQAFLTGAFDPSGRVAIDKPAPGLWPQVLSTRIFGFHEWALLVPAAIGGVAAVAALMWVVRSIAGRWAAVAAGAALAVLPAAVVTARSDTMDAVMAALVVVAFGLALRAARSGRLVALAASGALAGLAFEVKLVEALVPAGAALLAWLIGTRARRWTGAALWSGAFAACALAWLVAVTVLPVHPRPWALGSANGSPWQAALVYDGLDRLGGGAKPVAQPITVARTAAGRAARAAREASATESTSGPPGPLRLLSARRHLGVWIGLEAVAALAALAVALALGRKLDRAGLIALGAWLVAGIVLCSAMADLRPRYLELVDPAVAGVLGIGAAVLARRRPPAAYLVGGALACVLAVPFATSIAAVRSGTQDSGTVGALPAARLAALTAFLDRHPGELAATAPGAVASLIAGQSRPVLLLGDGLGRQLVTPRALAHSGARYALLGRCAGGGSGCLPVDLWARAHGRPLRVGGGLLYALTPGRAAADRGRTPTLARSRRAASHRGAAALAVAVPGIGARRHGRH